KLRLLLLVELLKSLRIALVFQTRDNRRLRRLLLSGRDGLRDRRPIATPCTLLDRVPDYPLLLLRIGVCELVFCRLHNLLGVRALVLRDRRGRELLHVRPQRSGRALEEIVRLLELRRGRGKVVVSLPAKARRIVYRVLLPAGQRRDQLTPVLLIRGSADLLRLPEQRAIGVLEIRLRRLAGTDSVGVAGHGNVPTM